MVLSRSWGLCSRSWAVLGAYVGGLGPLLGPIWGENAKNMATLKMCLFLERERDLRPGERSWAALGAYVGGLGPLLGPMLAVLGGHGPKSGPNLNGKAILQVTHFRKSCKLFKSEGVSTNFFYR